tara:strand:+ start:222 stop:1469 length:1248 start_codon:yes stop_codon:yes gene_type:complete
MKKKTIGFCGLSHLGLCYMAAFSEKKFNVIGYDFSKLKVNELNRNILRINEPKLKKILKNSNININNDIKSLKLASVIFISEDVTTNSNNISNYSKVLKYFLKIRNMFPNKKVVFLSQMKPNFFKKLNSKNRKNTYYQVETLVFGEGVKRALHPERIIISGETKIPGDLVLMYKRFTSNIIETNFQTAELIKIFINIFLISNLTTANYLSEISSKTGAIWQDIENSLRMDKRIGKFSYISPGLGVSGGNLERDLININNFSKEINLKIPIFNLFKQYSKSRKNWTYETFLKEINPLNTTKKKKILICGLSYKLNTHSTKNSPSLKLINKLKKHKFLNIYCYDPKIKNFELKKTKFIRSLKNIKDKFDFVFVMLPWKNVYNRPFFRNKLKKNTVIIDPYSSIKKLKIKRNKVLSLC